MSGKGPLIVIDVYRDTQVETLKATLDDLEDDLSRVMIWDSRDGPRADSVRGGRVIQAERRFLGSSSQDITTLLSSNACTSVLLVDGSVNLTSRHLKRLCEKWEEYDYKVILCSRGIRLYPHPQYDQPSDFWLDAKYYRLFDESATDREVHLFSFDGGLCLMLTKTLLNIIDFHNCRFVNGPMSPALVGMYLSYFAAAKFDTHLWKIELNEDVEKSSSCSLRFNVDQSDELSEFYSFICQENWPESICKPLLPDPTVHNVNKDTIWQRGFHGVNMSAEPVYLDFEACRHYGASVIRMGAVNDAKDLLFLVRDGPEDDMKTDHIHLQKMLPRLKNAINSASKCGLKVILTLCDLPGRRFHDTEDERMWRDESIRERIAQLWGAIIIGLGDLGREIVGYDVVNEPFTPEDNTKSFDSDISDTYIAELDDLYKKCFKAIRNLDTETPIIVESVFWASPRTLPMIKPIADPHVIYSFHFYAPSLYTYRFENDGSFKYPGPVPQWRLQKWPETWPLWDKSMIRSVIQPVLDWQTKYDIPSSQVFVGEFGVCREVPGAVNYLTDVIEVWNENKWSWCVFSFRDNEWDAMDYELGDAIDNQLQRTNSNMMQTIAKHFY